MKNTLLKAAVVILCIILGWTGSNIYHASKYQESMAVTERLRVAVSLKEAELEQVRRQASDEIDILRGMVTSASTVIANLEAENEDLHAIEEAQADDIMELRTAEVDELMRRYPALKAYDLAKDRLIDTKDKLIFNLSQQGAEKDKIIEAQGKQILLEREIGLSWKKQFEDQQALRIAQEEAFRHDRRGLSGSKLLYLVGGAAAGFLGGVVFH